MRHLLVSIACLAAASCAVDESYEGHHDPTLSDEPSVGNTADLDLGIDALAYELLVELNPRSIEDNTEYHLVIYRIPETGGLGWSTPMNGGRDGGRVEISFPAGTTPIAMMHTHGDYSKLWHGRISRTSAGRDTFDSDHFSQEIDVPFMTENALGFEAYYLGTPSGVFFQWDDEEGQVELEAPVEEPEVPEVAPCLAEDPVLLCINEECPSLIDSEFQTCFVEMCEDLITEPSLECAECIAQNSDTGIDAAEISLACSESLGL